MRNAIIGLKELRANTDTYIEAVKKGRSFIVVRKSKPIFRIAPPDLWGDEGEWETLVDFKGTLGRGFSAQSLIAKL